MDPASPGQSRTVVECVQRTDGSVEARNIHSEFSSTQHAERLKDVRSNVESASSIAEVSKLMRRR